MASRAPDQPGDRPRLETRLQVDLLKQGHYHEWRTANPDQLRELEARIQTTARRLKPDAPQAAIDAGRRTLAYDDLAQQILRRAELPHDPSFVSEPLEARMHFLEKGILDLARELEPADPRAAIAHAQPIALRHHARKDEFSLFSFDPAHRLAAGRRRIAETTQDLKRQATYPEPTRLQRVHQVLGDLRRLEVLDMGRRDDAQMRSQLSFRGNVVELKAALERMVEPSDLLKESATEIYRDPGLAIGGMKENIRSQGLHATIERFSENPAAFGKLRGVHIPGLGDTPGRLRALGLIQQSSASASTALTRRDRMERDLESAVTYQRRQNSNRDLIHAYPTREKLLTQLGQRMEGLEIHQVRPLLRPGQAKLVQDVRRAEQHFLEPLREASRSFRALDAGGAQLGAQAQKIAGLFQGAPRHIVSRLTPPQMQAVLMAVSIAKQMTHKVSKAMNA